MIANQNQNKLKTLVLLYRKSKNAMGAVQIKQFIFFFAFLDFTQSMHAYISYNMYQCKYKMFVFLYTVLSTIY